MSDVFSPEKRSEVMSKIQGKDTKPELKIRKALHALGYRYRIHDKNIKGKPDLKLTKYNALIFVHGCFWHGHDCHLFKWPQKNAEFWRNKITGNIERDKRNIALLRNEGWRVLVIWECVIKGKYSIDFQKLIDKIDVWLKSDSQFLSLPN